MIRPATVMVWVLALFPGLLALITLWNTPWDSAGAALSALGRLSGVLGLSFMLVAASLSSRVPGFDRPFGGLTKLWQTHHRLAAISFLLLMLHPILLALASGEGASGAFALLFPGSPRAGNWALWAGWFALLAMMIFLAPSFAFFGAPKYQRWKRLHRLAGLAILLALLHAFPLARALPHPWDYAVWITLTVLALAAVCYRWLFSRARLPGKGGRLPHTVSRAEKIAAGVVELTLAPEREVLHYKPGQFVYLTPYDKALTAGYGEEHPYTLSSSPTESQLRITIKDLGDASRAMQSIRVGSPVRIEGPYGAFFRSEEDEDSELWIAGGIGITPFLGRARYLREVTNEVDICLIYCVQDESRSLYKEELEAIAGDLQGFQLHFHYFAQQGPLTEVFIAGRCKHLQNRGAYICGPAELLSLGRRVTLASGIPAKRIQTEEFSLL